MNAPPVLFTPEEVAERLKVSVATVRTLIRTKMLNCLRITSRCVRVTLAHLEEFCLGNGVSAEVATEAVKPPVWLPSPFQQSVLDALRGRGLRTDELATIVGNRRRLFRHDGLPELQDLGLVRHHRRLGYYRPDDPPEKLKHAS